MKYIVVAITMRSGEYEATQLNVTELNDKLISMEEVAEDMAKDFYGDGGDELDGEYHFDDGSVITYVSSVKEITKEEYYILNKFI